MMPRRTKAKKVANPRGERKQRSDRSERDTEGERMRSDRPKLKALHSLRHFRIEFGALFPAPIPLTFLRS
jgi:hypothetical protein